MMRNLLRFALIGSLTILSSIYFCISTADDNASTVKSLNEADTLQKNAENLIKSEKQIDLQKAIVMVQRAALLREQVLGMENLKVADSWSLLGDLYLKSEQHDNAFQFYKRTLSIREKLLGINHPDVASTLDNLGVIFLKVRMYEDAEKCLTQSLEIKEKQPKQDNLEIAKTLDSLADVYRSQVRAHLSFQEFETLGREHFQKVKSLLQRALELRKAVLGEQHREVALSLMRLAEANSPLREYQEAENLYKKAIEIFEQTSGANSQDVAEACRALASMYRALNRYDESDFYEERAERIDPSEYVRVSYNENVLNVERYPTIECPDQVSSDQWFAVQILLTEEQLSQDVKILEGQTTAESKLSLDLKDEGSWQIDVVISAPGFSVRDGANSASIILTADGDSTPALFYLKAKTINENQKSEKIFATFWHEGVYLARVVTDITVSRGPAEHARKTTEKYLEVASNTQSARIKQSANVNTDLRAPSMTVWFLESLDPTQESTIIIHTPLGVSHDNFIAPKEISKWLDSKYAKFAHLLARGVKVSDAEFAKSRDQRLALLTGFGEELYDKFAPPAFKVAFWKLRKELGPQFRTIQIFTNNPVLPWELMRPISSDRSDRCEFLGVEYNIARWHLSARSEVISRPPQTVTIDELDVIAPEYNAEMTLPYQTNELEFLAKFPGYRRIAARFSELKTLFQNDPQGIIHFAGHGSTDSEIQDVKEYKIHLEDVQLDPLSFKGLAFKESKKHPFIFLNACAQGQVQRIANLIDGWAPAVLETGASGYIGGLWPIGDKGASEFSIFFYESLAKQLQTGFASPGEIIKEARSLFYKEYDPTFLSYVYYGDPNLELTQ